ncbi:hypothetical protein XELAEV_18036939mg [Xenopus laevis]|uniref:Zinc finger CCHC domain-containing protein n=1 Tax=Xenopus laevis TaxID=8355 RepID=A0A974CBA7_XENLA|nr:hypothetical protein XELAEV_18036939mg [Xenopus laevis]
MATASEESENRVALETDQVMAVAPMGKAEVSKGNVHKVTETVIQYDTIINALKEPRCLEDKQNCLNRDIDKLIKELKLLRGERKAQLIQELAFLNKELEETETYIKDILAVMEPWNELYGNQKRFKEMQEGKVTAKGWDAAFCILPAFGTYMHRCEYSHIEKTSVRLLLHFPAAERMKPEHRRVQIKPLVCKSHTVKTRLGSSRRATGLSMVVTLEHAAKGNVICSKGNKKKSKSCRSDMESNWRLVMEFRMKPERSVEQVAERGAAEVHVVDATQSWRRFFARERDDESDYQIEKRINVVKIKGVNEREDFLGCRFVARNIIKQLLDFTPQDIYALTSVTDAEFDVSFKLSQGLEEFWRRYHVNKETREREGFRVIPVSKPETKEMSTPMPGENLPQTETGGGRRGQKGNSKKKVKEKKSPGVITISTQNRFVLPGGKSWGELAEEEEAELERMKEEEAHEKRKSLSSVISNRKKSKREEASESQKADWESLEEEEGEIVNKEAGVRIQVKRSGDKSSDKSLNKKHKDVS